MKNYFYFLILLCVSIFLSSCSSEPSKFYVLNPINSSTQVKKQAHYRVGLKSIQLAKYLQQPQIVTRKTNHELHLDEFNRWAEPLRDNIQQVLQNNLQHLLKHAIVDNYPWSASFDPKFTVNVSIIKFDTNIHGRSLLQANIEIEDASGKVIKVLTNKRYITQAAHNNYNAIVAAMNSNLTKLSRSLASQLLS